MGVDKSLLADATLGLVPNVVEADQVQVFSKERRLSV